MKRILHLLLVVCMMCLSFAAMAEDYTMPKKDGFIGEKVVDSELTFYDMGGPTGVAPTYFAGYVRFVPKNAGEQLTITFDELDLQGAAKLYIYDGDAEFASYSSKIKDDYLAEVSGSTAGLTYTATSGQLSVLYYCKGSANNCKGWKATISSSSPKPMEFVSAGVIEGLNPVTRGAKDVTIFGANVVTDGSQEALTLNDLTIDCGALVGSTQVKNIRLYSKKVSDDNLVATAATVGDKLSVKDYTLSSKDNNFFVVADVLPDASGEIPSLKLASVKVAGEARTPLTETGSAVAVDNVILMPSQATTFTIDEDAKFYDDGGIDGKISSKFTGTITFVPATSGKKVKIDFTKLAIFNTSSTGLNDVLKIYNGKEAVEKNLLCTLLKEAKVVKSTADDGALTVTLVSTTGVPAQGWEAIVSQFVPGDMKLASFNVTAAEGANVAAGDENQQMFTVNAVTDNVSNPLKVSSVNLKVADGTDASLISKVKVYYLGEKDEFATTNLFGEATVADGKVVVNGEKVLPEGNNYFAVVADVAETAMNGNKLGLVFESMTIAAEAKTPAEAVSAVRTVENVCHATKGSHSHKMYGDWKFTDTKSKLYPSKYEYENADYIVTFTPTEAGHVAAIEFSKFDVEYSSSASYGTHAVFEVYSGKTTAADKLLWKLSSFDESKKGPGKKLYSDADDGSMTIKFNPSTTSSYYAATGWEADVTQYKSHDMTIEEVEATHPSVKAVTPGAKNEVLLGVRVKTEGTLTKRVLKSISLDLKDTQKSLDKITILSSGGDNDFEKATTTYGSVTEFGDGKITVNGELTLRSENNYLWVMADVKENAISGDSIDAKLTLLTTDMGETNVANGDPEGSRTIKNMMNMKSGDNGVYVVKRPMLLYDDGGPDDKFTKNFKGTITFVPEEEDAVVTVNAKQFAMGASKMYIYSGREVNAEKLLGTKTYFGTTNGPVNLASKAEDGSLTIRVETASTQLDGFELEIDVRKKQSFNVTSVTAGAATERGNVVRGIAGAELVKANVVVAGDKDPMTVNSFKFVTTGTTAVEDITKASLYYTSAANNFLRDNLLASTTEISSGGEVEFTLAEPLKIADIGDNFFWFAVDLKADAAAGNVVAAKLVSLTVNGAEVEAEKITSEAASRTIKQGFKGEYTIGASSDADYATIEQAVAALGDGVESAVTFKIEDGTYRENIYVKDVEGTSEEHPIKFVSKSGNRDGVIITGGGYSEPAYGVHKLGMFAVENTPYVTVEALSLIPESQSYPMAMQVYNQSRHFTLKNCVVKAETVKTGYKGINLVQAESINEEGKNNDYMTIEDCSLEGGYIALYLGGTNFVSLTKERGLVVRNNTITDAGSKGVYVVSEADALIEGNRVISTKTEKTSYAGFDLYRCVGKFIVKNNYIYNSQPYYSNGIYLRECFGTQAEPAMVYNNVISIVSSPTDMTSALYISVESKNIKLLYNTARVSGNAGYAFFIGGSAKYLDLTNVTIANNLLQSDCNSGKGALYFNEKDYVKGITFKNNAYYFASGALVKDMAANLEEYVTLTGDATSFVEKADFLSETDLRLNSAGNMQKAQPMADVTVDFRGKARSTTAPTIGAYEFEEIKVETPEIVEGYPVAGLVTKESINVKTKWTVGGKLYAKLVKSEEAAPTAEELLAVKAVECTENTEVSSTFNSLTESTAYKAYFMVVSALDVQSAVVASAEITTARDIPALTLELTSIYDMIDAGASCTIEPTVDGGDAPYTYEWRNQMNEVIGTDAKLTVTPSHTSQYTVKVTSKDGQWLKAKTAVYVSGAMVNATFDDNYLNTESYWNGDGDGDNTFYSGSFAFINNKNTSWDSWSGFAYANSKKNTFTALSDQYRNIVGGGVDGSDGYAVSYYMGEYYGVTPRIEVTNNVDGEIISGVYVTNTPYAVSSMEKGDGYTKAFKTGDYYKVVFTGFDANNATKTVEYYLADYRSETEADHYIVKDWKWVDLSTLGAVTKINVSVAASQSGVPSYVAFDNLGASKPSGIKDVEMGGVNIYPVPTVDVLHIDGATSANVVVYSVSGQMVGNYQLEDGTIDVSDLASGVYVVQVNTANGVVKKQFVKM